MTASKDNEKALPDIYGQVHPHETPKLIESKLEELAVEITHLSERKGLDEAMEKCPQLVNDLCLAFLRCEVFNAKLAAKRMASYWDKRIEIFCPTKAFLPLEINQALRDEAVAIQHGFCRLTGKKDPSGRAIVFVDPSRQDRSLYSRESMVRAFWYMLHAALEDDTTQQRGIIFVASLKNARLSEFDQSLLKMGSESLQGCIPVRVSAFHICHPPTFFSLIYPIFKLLMGPRLRKRITVHSSWQEKEILSRLEGYGLTPDLIPEEVGGDLILDHDQWLMDRTNNNL